MKILTYLVLILLLVLVNYFFGFYLAYMFGVLGMIIINACLLIIFVKPIFDRFFVTR